MPPQRETSKPPTLTVPLGFTGAVRLIAAPITEVVLDAPKEQRINALDTEIVVRGTCKGFSEPTVSASLSWLVRYDSGATAEHTVGGKMHIKDNRFELKVGSGKSEGAPKLSVLQHRLFGRGAVGYRLTPVYPHAPTAVVEAEKIRFDNPLAVTTKPATLGAALVGQPVVFALTRGALTDKLLDEGFEVQLRIAEEDTGKGEKRTAADLQEELVWKGESRKENKTWLVGCTAGSTSASPKLAYPEAQETDGHELGYRLYVSKPKDKWPTEAAGVTPLATLALPLLRSFSLETRVPFLSDAPSIVAAGTITGFDPRLGVSVVLTPWRRGERPNIYVQASPPVVAELNGDGTFRATLWEASLLAAYHRFPGSLESWLLSLAAPSADAKPTPTLFASVRLNESLLANPKMAAAYTSLGFDAKQMDTIVEGTGYLGSPLTGTAVCSAESRGGAAFALAVKQDLEQRLAASGETYRQPWYAAHWPL